jgi:hypothetical protein
VGDGELTLELAPACAVVSKSPACVSLSVRRRADDRPTVALAPAASARWLLPLPGLFSDRAAYPRRIFPPPVARFTPPPEPPTSDGGSDVTQRTSTFA